MISILSNLAKHALNAEYTNFEEFELTTKIFVRSYLRTLLDLIALSNRMFANSHDTLITIKGTLFARIATEYEYSDMMIKDVRAIFAKNEEDRGMIAKDLFDYFHKIYLDASELRDAIDEIFKNDHRDNPYTVKLMVADWLLMD